MPPRFRTLPILAALCLVRGYVRFFDPVDGEQRIFYFERRDQHAAHLHQKILSPQMVQTAIGVQPAQVAR
jgi:hypothetical protein